MIIHRFGAKLLVQSKAQPRWENGFAFSMCRQCARKIVTSFMHLELMGLGCSWGGLGSDVGRFFVCLGEVL